MLHEDAETTIDSLLRVKKICKIFDVVFRCVCVFIFIWWIASSISLASYLLQSDQFEKSGVVGISALLVFSFTCIVLIAFFRVLSKMFFSLGNGASPFSLKQVERLRVLAILLVFYFGLLIASSYVSVLLNQNGIYKGFFATGANANSFITIDPAPLLISAVFFALSFVFEYGLLLQAQSDDTV